MPLFYCPFDCIPTLYTDVLYSGAQWAVQLMPPTISVCYFVFIILCHGETQKQARVQRERDMLDAWFFQARKELSSLRQLRQNAAAYRHDTRRHFALSQGLAAKGHIEEMREYLKTTQSDLDAITPVRFCENETANLVLSSFVGKACRAGVLPGWKCPWPGSA